MAKYMPFLAGKSVGSPTCWVSYHFQSVLTQKPFTVLQSGKYDKSQRSLVKAWFLIVRIERCCGPQSTTWLSSVSELTCIYSALIRHNDEVTVTALANINIGSLICNGEAGAPTPAAEAAPANGPPPSTAAAAAEEKKVEAKKEESEELEDDMGFGFFD
ncbi:60S acidic ribosomal protein P1-like [Grammomys surdaster]|uniref:60S acidic ribosomal protein P1-like n=1 Tax=Grammomys surdaster TaxID=491861 RepID=UPI00109EF47C|nr:60S acidic ribosomal protein P1-like [Grammomys surdaster]